MAYDFKPFKEKTGGILEWLRKEFSSIRTGRAAPAVLDSVLVDSYGTKMSVRELANIGIEDTRTLRISPYDLSQSKNIEKAVVLANLGLSVSVDERGVRAIFPELTAERRNSYVKIAKERLEEGRKKLRAVRDEAWKDIQSKERDGKIGEDEKFRLKNEMEKIVHDFSKQTDDLFAKKEREIKS